MICSIVAYRLDEPEHGDGEQVGNNIKENRPPMRQIYGIFEQSILIQK